MTVEHTFLGTWEIVNCTFEGNQEASGLEGIKFRLDSDGDITWYNDLINPVSQSRDCNIYYDSVSVLSSCETFDVNKEDHRLIFGAFAGHSIEFKSSTIFPNENLILDCENWYTLHCRRVKEDQAIEQEKKFSFIDALKEHYFSDVIIRSSDGLEYNVHAVVLRLNGFDCSMCCESAGTFKQINNSNYCSNSNEKIKISITLSHDEPYTDNDKSKKKLNLSPIDFQQIPTSITLNEQKFNLLSNSFNCLSVNGRCDNDNDDMKISLKKYPISSSDSNLQSNLTAKSNIFNFCNDTYRNAQPEIVCFSRKPPLSPYRARSPSPFPNSIETPPSSPLIPVAVLNNLPSFMLTPLLHWLYTESLIPHMNEDTCEKLINFAEMQPSLTKVVEPCRKYLLLIRLKKFVIDIITDIHDVIDNIIQIIDPIRVSHRPENLFAVFKDCLRQAAIGCAKILQFCNIFIKDAAGITKNQKNEIIKYVRTRIPIFVSQIHQLLKNILKVLLSLNDDEKQQLVIFLIPEIELSFNILETVVEEIKNSLEKMCKDMKCSHLDLSIMKRTEKSSSQTTTTIAPNLEYLNIYAGNRANLYNISSSVGKHYKTAENDLKFVLYMYEVRKMRDIYGRISIVLDVIKEKRLTFCEMNFLDKKSTINQNLEQLIMDIPTYIHIIDNISDRLEDKIGWKEFKFCFKLATSQINGVIIKLLDHKLALSESINQICELVKMEEFTRSLTDLRLLERSNIFQNDLKTEKDTNDKVLDYKSVKLNLVKNLLESPNIINSSLSKNALRLLHSGQLTDMEFDVYVPPTIQETSDSTTSLEKSKPLKIHTFRAHRVILSARCEWFKKAFLSGMLETITRKIVITDTSPVIFRRLLLYIYGAPIDKTVGAEEICELMLLADRYSIEELKEICESTLNALIDEDSVVCLLGIADRYRTSGLKSKCLEFLSQNEKLTKLDMFKELPKRIQQEVKDLIHWYGRVPEPWNDRQCLKNTTSHRSKSRNASPSNK